MDRKGFRRAAREGTEQVRKRDVGTPRALGTQPVLPLPVRAL